MGSRIRCVWLAAFCVVGCARFRGEQESAGSPLAPPRMSPDTMVLEQLVLELPGEVIEPIWRDVEEPLTAESRRHLEENGLWVGRTGQQLPSVLRTRLDAPVSSIPDEQGKVAGVGERWQSRAGQRKVVRCGKLHPELSLLRREVDGALRGETYAKAYCQYAVRVFPLGDGRARVQLSPEIEHGDPRMQRLAEEGLWQIRVTPDVEPLNDLSVEVILAPGQTLLVGPTPDPKGVGAQFFANEGHRLLLLRLAHSQADDLFAPNSVTRPVVE